MASPGEQPLKVWHVASGDLWAGAETQVYNLLLALRRRGDIEPAAILFNEGEMARRLRAAGIPVTVHDESRMASASIALRMRHALRSARPEILHGHGKKENILALLAAFRAPVGAVVGTVHGAAEHSASLLRPDKQLSELLDRVVSGRGLDTLIAVSAPLAEQLRVRYPRQRVRVIANGVDCDALAAAVQPLALPQADATLKVGLVGRLTPVKRADLFLRIAAELEKRGVDSACYVAGEGPELDGAKALAADLDLHHTHFLGFVQDVPSLLAQLDIVCMPSDHEGLPMTLLEALSLGCGVVVHAVGAMPEVVERCGGIALQDRSPVTFADAIERLAAERCGVDSLRVRSVAAVRCHYSSDSCAQAHAALYRELLGNR